MSILASGLGQMIGAIGGSAISAGANITTNKLTNQTNYDIAQDTNKTNLQISRMTNQANRDLANEQMQHEIDMWNMNNAYNDPSAQVQRIAAAGINPLTAFSNGGNAGNSSAPPNVPDMANQVTGAPMQAATLDPLTFDDSLAQSILAGFKNRVERLNADTSQKVAESTIKVNEWSVKSVEQQIVNMKTQNDIDVQLLPLMLEEKQSVIDSNKASKKLMDRQREAIDTACDLSESQIYKNYSDVVARFQEIDISDRAATAQERQARAAERQAAAAEQNARTHAQEVANSYDIALKNFEAMSMQQLLNFAQNFHKDTNLLNFTKAGMGFSAGSSGGSTPWVPGMSINGSFESGDQSGSSNRNIDIEKAIEAYGKLAAYNVRLLHIIKNPGTSQEDKAKAIETLGKTSRYLSPDKTYLLHKLRTDAITKKQLLQMPVDGYQNPMNASTY